MPGKRLSLKLRAEIAALYPMKSMGQLAQIYKVSKHTVHNIVNKKKTFGTVVDRPKSGRPRISSKRDDRRLVRLALRDRIKTAGALRHLW
jgi:transposase